LCWWRAYWCPIKTYLHESTGIPVPWLIADMIVLHSHAEMHTFSFYLLWLFLGLPPCALTTKLSPPSSSSATPVMIMHTWCMLLMYLSSDLRVLSSLLETPPF
jgi:hypothetical protein